MDDGFCFACGRHNAAGMHLHFGIDADGSAVARTRIAPHFQGWQGFAHGGIVMTLLDEAMAYGAGAAGWKGVTAELSTRFRKPVPLESDVVLRGEVVWHKRNVIALRATVCAPDGTVLAEADGKFMCRQRIEPGTLGQV